MARMGSELSSHSGLVRVRVRVRFRVRVRGFRVKLALRLSVGSTAG